MPPPEPPPPALPPMVRRRSRRHSRRLLFERLRRIAFVVLLVVVSLATAPWLAVTLFVDADTLREQIEAAAQRATGRALSLGKVTMLSSLPPTLGAEGVTFANPPGASRRDMLRIAYAEATFDTVALLFGRLEIGSLVISRPDLALETDPAGTGNWQLAARPAAVLPDRSRHSRRPRWARRHAAQEKALVTLDLLRIREGQLAWRGTAGSWRNYDIKRLDVAAPGLAEPAVLTAQIGHANRTVGVTFSTGRLDRLRDPAATTAWPVRLELETPGAHASIAGTMSRPLDLAGYALEVEGAAENLGELQELLHARLPPLRKLVFRTRLADSGGPVPDISAVSLRASRSDLDAWVPGLSLDALNLAADSFDRPVRAEIYGFYGRDPLHLVAALGAPAALLTPGLVPGRLPVELSLDIAGGSLTVKGGIAAPERGSGLDLDVAAAMPDAGALSPLTGIALPGLHNLTFGLHAGDGEGGFRQGLALRNLALRAAEADLAGEVDVRFAERTPIRAVLTGGSLDLDGLRGAPLPGALPAASPPAAPPVSGPGPAGRGGGWIIPSAQLPFAGLTRTDLDLRVRVAELRLAGTLFRDASLVAGLRDGVLTVDPFTAVLPGGGIALRGELNGHLRFPPVGISLQASGLPVRSVLGLLGLPDDATGTLSVVAGLTSAGVSWSELAGGVTGQLGVVTTGAELDPKLFESVFGPALRAVGVTPPGAVPPGHRTPVRCLALQLDSKDGLASLHGFVLDTPALLLQGDGALQLRDERLALRFQPVLHGSAQPVAAVRVGGVFSRTTVYPEQAGDAAPVAAGAARPDPCAESAVIARAAVPDLGLR